MIPKSLRSRVAESKFIPGDSIRHGRVKVREAEEQLAQWTYQRWRDSPKGVVSVQEQESKLADYNSAKARLTSANAEVAADQGDVDRLLAMSNFKNITAPFDGIVTARETDIGALINAGSGTGGGSGPELFRVADVHMMRIYVQVPQQLSAGIKAGLNAELQLPQYPDKTFKAVVATTSSAINTNARTLLVELHADNPDGELQPGAYAQVAFELPSDPNIVRIPTSALVFREHGMEVATIGADDPIALRPIKLGRNLGTEVEVVQGLTLSDRLVNSPPDSLATGDKVRVAGAPQGGRHTGATNEAVRARRDCGGSKAALREATDSCRQAFLTVFNGSVVSPGISDGVERSPRLCRPNPACVDAPAARG
jgi:RND family efflux transporter MFP subunit